MRVKSLSTRSRVKSVRIPKRVSGRAMANAIRIKRLMRIFKTRGRKKQSPNVLAKMRRIHKKLSKKKT